MFAHSSGNSGFAGWVEKSLRGNIAVSGANSDIVGVLQLTVENMLNRSSLYSSLGGIKYILLRILFCQSESL